MSKMLWSVIVLTATILLSIVFYVLLFKQHPVFGEFWNLLWFGLTTFFLGCGIWLAAHLMEKSFTENKNKTN